MSGGDYYSSTGRKERNENSKHWAVNDGEAWSLEEQKDLLQYWDGHDEKLLIETSEVMGRTIEACRQRWHECKAYGGPIPVASQGSYRRTTTSTTTTTTTEYIGAFDDPEDMWWA